MQLPTALESTFNVLAFDASTERIAVALHRRGTHIGTGAVSAVRAAGTVGDGDGDGDSDGGDSAAGQLWVVDAAGGPVASSTLLPQANALLARAGLGYADLDFIAYGSGPGAFTGLRTACAVAKGIGLGIGMPLLAIDSLLIVAEDARLQVAADAEVFEVGVAMDARMAEVYAGAYRWESGRWQVSKAPALASLQALPALWSGLTLAAVAGSALSAFGERLVLPAQALRVPQEAGRAAALMRLALAVAAAGRGIDAAAALPLYLRDKVALTIAERELARGAV